MRMGLGDVDAPLVRGSPDHYSKGWCEGKELHPPLSRNARHAEPRMARQHLSAAACGSASGVDGQWWMVPLMPNCLWASPFFREFDRNDCAFLELPPSGHRLLYSSWRSECGACCPIESAPAKMLGALVDHCTAREESFVDHVLSPGSKKIVCLCVCLASAYLPLVYCTAIPLFRSGRSHLAICEETHA